MKYSATLFMLLMSIGATTNAQIILTKSDITGVINVTAYKANYSLKDTTGVSAAADQLAAKKGTEQTWDVSKFSYSVFDTSISVFLAGTSGVPGANDPRLGQANYVSKDWTFGDDKHTNWTFFTITDTVDQLGATSATGDSVTSKTIYNPPLHQIVFPTQYGVAWKVGTLYDTVHTTYNGIPVSIPVQRDLNFEIDGEGTVVRPNLPPIACLRLKQTANTKIGPVLTQTFYDTSSSYSFINHTDFDLASFTPTHTTQATLFSSNLNKTADISYGAPVIVSIVHSDAEDEFALAISANPVSNSAAHFLYSLKNAGNIQITIMDNLGREVHQLFHGYAEVGQNSIPIDPSKFANGTYFIRITADGMTAMKKLIVIR
jgi:hypothetical protein